MPRSLECPPLERPSREIRRSGNLGRWFFHHLPRPICSMTVDDSQGDCQDKANRNEANSDSRMHGSPPLSSFIWFDRKCLGP